MRVGYLGAGAWGYTMASLLAKNGHEVLSWSQDSELVESLNRGQAPPKFPKHLPPSNLKFTTQLSKVREHSEILVEAVTSAGLRPTMERLKQEGDLKCPIILTSKGIEQNTGLFLTEVIADVFGAEARSKIGCLSGPSIAIEVLRGYPASLVCSGYDTQVMEQAHRLFSCPSLRVYPNPDVHGVELGGAMKNIIAIACGASDGLGFGDNAKAALMTRGLHEIRRLALKKGCLAETIHGLAGMGDLCVTCLSKYSRNYQFGYHVAQGMSLEEAKHKIGMVVEGAYTCLSAMQIAKREGIELPIACVVYQVCYEGLQPKEAVKILLQRATKKEYL